MYYIKRGKQSKAFLKCLQTAALKGKLPKRYLFKCLRIKTGKILHFIKDELCEAFHEAKTVSASAVVLVAVGGAVTALALNLCILHVKVADLQTEKTQLTHELTETRTELKKNIEDLTTSLESNQQESKEKDEIIEAQKDALANSETEKEELIKNFTEQIDNLDLVGNVASRSSIDLDIAHSSFSEVELLIRDTLGYTETANALIERLNMKENVLRDVADRYPDFFPTTGEVGSPFGYRSDPITGETRFHSGLDIGQGTGTPIWAAAKGTVVYAGYDDGYGYHICIDHGNGLSTKYAHCSELLVSVGDEVGKGDLIERMGGTGRATGPHLHFEVIKDGERVNPADYIC